MKTKGFGLIEIIIAVAVIALLGGGGLYFYNTNNNKSLIETGLDAKKQAEELKNIIEERSKEAVSEVDTSTWKTYRNEKYGFEVRYPAEWQQKIRDDNTTFQVDLLRIINGNSELIRTDHFIISIFKQYQFLNIIKTKIQKGKNFSIGGTDALREKITEYSEIIEFIHDGNLFTIALTPSLVGKTELLNEDLIKNSFAHYDLMISTFKFIPSTSSGQVK